MQRQKQIPTSIKVVYSLRVHMELQSMGFQYIQTMPNPKNENLNCWIYEATPAFLDAFDGIIEERRRKNG